MKSEEVRFVWMFVFFDLPVGTKTERRGATRFRNFLKDDGFMMLQWSVYARVCRGDDAADKHVARVTKNLPPRGSVRALQVTDRQYARMKLLLGEATFMRKTRPSNWFCSDTRPMFQAEYRSNSSARADGAYHGEIGREATARLRRPSGSLPRGNR